VPAPKIGVLGQAAPAAGATVVAYTVPANRRAVVSTISIAETGGNSGTYRVHVGVNGAAAAVGNAIAYDIPYSAKQATFLTIGATLGPGDVLYVESSAGAVTFTAFGEETDVPTA